MGPNCFRLLTFASLLTSGPGRTPTTDSVSLESDLDGPGRTTGDVNAHRV